MLAESAVVRAMQVINVVQATFVFALDLNLCFSSIPMILQSPSPILAVRQWNLCFAKGVKYVFPLCWTCVFNSVYLAFTTYYTDPSSSTWKFYMAACAFAFGIFPFTYIFVNDLNNRLVAKGEQVKTYHYRDLPDKDSGISSDKIHRDIATWGSLNKPRSVIFGGTALSSALALFF